jgi:5-oxoprolinase (ATP-hydrolysing)
MAGGQPGQPGRNWVERVDGQIEEMGHIGSVHMEPGDLYVIQTPGGGGFGKN